MTIDDVYFSRYNTSINFPDYPEGNGDMIMKKILALTLAILMVVGLFAACGSDEEKGNSAPETTAPVAEGENASDVTAPVDDETGPVEEVTEGEATAAEITTVSEGKLIMATNAYFPPYEYYEGDQIVGIDAVIAAAIADKLGLELEIQNMQFDSIITAVSEGAADIGLAGMTITDERKQQINFTISYASGVQSIIVKEGSPITCVDDLYAEGAAYKVGVQLGTTGDIYASDDFGDLVTQYTNGNEAVLALTKGDIDCVIIDNEPAKAFVEANEGLTILETAYAEEDYAACIAKENTALLAAVDQAILELTEDGTIDTIIEMYIPVE